MNFGHRKTDGSVFIFFELYEIEKAYEYFFTVKELEEKNGKSVPLLEDIICKDKSYGLFCFEFTFKNREFVILFLETMIEAYKAKGPIEEISKLESTLSYINFYQDNECLN